MLGRKGDVQMSTTEQVKISDHFTDKDPTVQAIYQRLLAETRQFGPVIEQPKKTSIHLVNKSAFAGVVTRKSSLLLNIKSAAPIRDARIVHFEQVSSNRFHQEVKLTSLEDIDSSLLGWLKTAYEMSS
jgi:hypothetical protein